MRRRYLPVLLILVIALLSGSLLVLRGSVGGRSGTESRGDVAAPVAPPAMTPIAGTLVPSQPFTERVVVTLLRGTLASGPAAGTALPVTGHQLIAVEAGIIIASLDGADRQLNAGGSLTVSTGQSLAITNPGLDPAIVVLLYLDPIPTGGVAGEPERSHMSSSAPGLPAGSTYHVVLTARLNAFPFIEGELHLERLTLTAGMSAPPFQLPEHAWVGIGAGTLGLTLEGARLPLGWKPGDEQEISALRTLPLIPVGTQLTLRNAGTDELVLYQVTLTMSERWMA